MFSSFLKAILVLSGLSPSFLILEFINLYIIRNSLTVNFQLSSFPQIVDGLWALLSTHFFLILFLLCIFSANVIIGFARKRLPPNRIIPKTIKPADTNLLTMLSLFCAPFLKFTGASDIALLFGYLALVIVYIFIVKNSYHFNLTLKLFLGYSNYEVQTTGDVTFLVLSKENLINKNMLTEFVFLTNYMLLNTSTKN